LTLNSAWFSNKKIIWNITHTKHATIYITYNTCIYHITEPVYLHDLIILHNNDQICAISISGEEADNKCEFYKQRNKMRENMWKYLSCENSQQTLTHLDKFGHCGFNAVFFSIVKLHNFNPTPFTLVWKKNASTAWQG